MAMMEDFEAATVDAGGVRVFMRRAGSGAPVLLLHGFPETHLMWRDVAPLLAKNFTVICADLPGYGDSGCPDSTPDHAPYSKRAMANDMARMMERLGFERFAVAGHDRGGRVAYRMALDHPERVARLAVLDIVPTVDAWQRADARLLLAFWPWSLLAQPEPLPERILSVAAEAIVDDALSQWGSASDAFPPEVRAAYVRMLRDPAHAHAICEEYRAAASLDRAHDEADGAAGRRIACPVLALWSGAGALGSWYEAEGGPLALWRRWAGDVRGQPVGGGHFFPEEMPEQTAALLTHFLAGKPA
jgi:haloacetate dehalogenase